MALIITLILLGVVLLLMELLIIPGFGITGILGLLALVGGVVMSYYKYDDHTGHFILAGTIIICMVFAWFALRPKTWKRLSLTSAITSQAVDTAAGRGLAAGMQGVTLTRLSPVGTVKVNNVQIEATAFEGIIGPAQQVEIVKLDNTKVIVKPIKLNNV
ncbi:MAG: NfeD family protein [Prevotellaceae bacterium]|jgi:membrane-bound ClpP family serine protease|nr:NfeD family protein [Prevotellaceae bacterium]